ncbi:hypothetical protein C8F04DRAFT_1182528 [Mycena alexandri]|uniref:Uncharacterized protein n=1 Tax=Mycena alexandri TaxID=1745969 RepID=A0AAD6SWI5_9AGAR|nr:hypothetical protein C8F04DRAFT_1182528 [Mycena alexandri]
MEDANPSERRDVGEEYGGSGQGQAQKGHALQGTQGLYFGASGEILTKPLAPARSSSAILSNNLSFGAVLGSSVSSSNSSTNNTSLSTNAASPRHSLLRAPTIASTDPTLRKRPSRTTYARVQPAQLRSAALTIPLPAPVPAHRSGRVRVRERVQSGQGHGNVGNRHGPLPARTRGAVAAADTRRGQSQREGEGARAGEAEGVGGKRRRRRGWEWEWKGAYVEQLYLEGGRSQVEASG